MKSTIKLLLLVAAAALVPGTVGGEDGTFVLETSSIDGGGGFSSGGGFELTGTIGQHDAGQPQFGGPFALTTGIWAGVLQNPGSPLLGIRRESGGAVTVFWPFPSAGFVLRESPSLGEAPMPWVDVIPLSIQNDGVINFVTIAVPAGQNYYALFPVP